MESSSTKTCGIQSRQSELLGLLVCPRDKQDLLLEGSYLVCDRGHRYAVVDGIPILLVPEAEQTHIEATRALAVAESGDTTGLAAFQLGPGEIDPFVRGSIGATNGGLYQHLVGKLTEYPIPRLRLPPGENRFFLEIGCNWGRWCIAAARMGYRTVGIDPSLKSIRAAYRVARQMGIDATYVVADGRYLPFRDQSFDQIFSYSVLQHLSKENTYTTLDEIHRTLCAGGNALVQLPNVYGIRCLYHQIRRAFREPHDFEVRYWTPAEILSAFTARIGVSHLSVDGFFSLNVQPSDIHLFPVRYRALVYASEVLRRMSSKLPLLINAADSLYVSASRAS
jgi:SAM-dependent methyltransferase/uncharacterized protein YbaR (Trm112 family)